MPRTARPKYQNKDCYYHLYNHISCKRSEFPLSDVCKDFLIREMRRLSVYYTVEIISFCVMSNHFHLVVFASKDLPPDDEVCARHNAFYKEKREPLMLCDRRLIAHHAMRMRNISEFMKDLQRGFTVWYNKVVEPGRMGGFWSNRFKSTILGTSEQEVSLGGSALLRCIEYVELNPVRAEIVDDPADYRFSSWGMMEQSGKHPFEQNFVKHLSKVIRLYGGLYVDCNNLANQLRGNMARIWAYENGYDSEHIFEIAEQARQKPSLSLRLNRRCRYWVDGMIIGSKTFIRQTAADLISEETAEQKHLAHIANGDKPCSLHSFRLTP